MALTEIRHLYPSAPSINFRGSLARWSEKNKQYIECEEVIKRLPSAQPKQRKRKGRDAFGRLIVDGWHLEVRDAEITKGEIPHIIRVGIDGFDHKGAWFTCWLEGEKHE